MTLISAPSPYRNMLTCKEVADRLALTKRQVEHLNETGKLRKSGRGRFAYSVRDVNQFIVRINAGKAS